MGDAAQRITYPDADRILSECPACTAPVWRAESDPIPLCADCSPECRRCGAIDCQTDHDAQDAEDAHVYARAHRY